MARYDDDDDEFDEDDIADEEAASDTDDEDTVPCPYCGEPIYDDAVRCPECERYLSREDVATTTQPKWVVITALIVLVLLLFAYLR